MHLKTFDAPTLDDALRRALIHEPEQVTGDAPHLDFLRALGDPVAAVMAVMVDEVVMAVMVPCCFSDIVFPLAMTRSARAAYARTACCQH